MFSSVIVLLIFGFAGLLFLPVFRRGILEELKSFSDALLLRLLRSTSGFGRELTKDGAAEQQMHREQRLRNLRGLALRAKEAGSGQRVAGSTVGEKEDG
ncbi:MAG: hypothetical protein A3F90_07915 [Deltaproteobacteria bacterium RIFCSPLOWO2_12_FULL_60_19]|nr:MAG: hypothetical protein A3F90_07915 [Deltaproteobacteria bacterium RIFCSPLOWO2_12_FULL_60_19]